MPINPEDHINELLEMINQSSPDSSVARLAKDGVREQIRLLLRERNEAVRRAEEAGIDYLTGLGNRRALEERKQRLEDIMQSQRRDAPQAVVVLSADIIDLKGFNAQSQKTGDEVIRAVATTVADSLSKPFRGEWYRRGGDEFIGLVPVYDQSGVDAVLLRMTQEVPGAYQEARLTSQADLPGSIPVLCAYSVYRQGADYASLNEAEHAADPKTAGKDRIIDFSS